MEVIKNDESEKISTEVSLQNNNIIEAKENDNIKDGDKILDTEIENLKNEINTLKIKNNSLKNENKALNIKNDNLKNEIKDLNIKNENLKNEKQLLKEEFKILNQERSNLKIKVDNLDLIRYEEIKKLDEKYKKLSDEKMKIIDDLISKMSCSIVVPDINNNPLSSGEKLIAINFVSLDQHINHSIICKNKTKFHEIESELYVKYPEYAESDNYFMFNGLKINRWKTLEEIGILGYTIILNKIDDE